MNKNYKKPKVREEQIKFKNELHDGKVNPVKNFYGIIDAGGSEKLYTYETKFWSDATSYFERRARGVQGKLKLVNVFK